MIRFYLGSTIKNVAISAITKLVPSLVIVAHAEAAFRILAMLKITFIYSILNHCQTLLGCLYGNAKETKLSLHTR